MPFHTIGNIIGVKGETIKKWLIEYGVTLNKTYNSINPKRERQAVVSAYLYGFGIKGISDSVGCSIRSVINTLISNNINLRTASEQETIKWSIRTPEQRAKQVAQCHKSTIGRNVGHTERLKRSKSREGVINKRSKYEPIVRDVLSNHKLNYTIAKAADVYNLDFSIGNVAVEVFGGGWSLNRDRITKYIKRTIKIAELGYHCIFIVFGNRLTFNGANLIANIKQLNSLPPGDCEYRVVWGDFNGSSGFSRNLEHSAFVFPFVNVRDAFTGRYKRIPR